MTSDILTHTEAGVLTLTINRPAKKNSLINPMYEAMIEALTSAATDTQVRVVLIQGHETAFTAGNDLGEFLHTPPVTADAPAFRFLRCIAGFPKPLIAAVAGPAVGVGTTLLLHCDLVFAGDNAVFSVPFVNLGLCPEAAVSYLLPRLFGHQRASEALLTGEAFYAEAAQEAGLVCRIVPPTELNAYAQAQARKMAAKPLASLIETKRLLKLGVQPHINARIEEEREVFQRMLVEPAAKEAFSAFLDKRKPDFSQC
ncbi:enoyl-CoA hydratase [Comamonas serinivorans]|uniref:Enoyl-CoA hydratase n=1 Tax=Comamonas serinivorans TaxID=1082851 RepID=A0A1Y0EKR4_9BURK|nr:enoyl-CoA hydratase [Comamonas serinivorans]ARU03882.1 enoyl-CoA hydratase [Comamonas serinivorans]